MKFHNLPDQILIGLGYSSGVGKSSIAHYLVDHHGFIRMSIAHKLKSVASSLLDDEVIDGAFKERLLIRSTGREFLQKLAEFLRYEFGSDYFVCNMRLREMIEQHKRIVIDDVRFAEEVDYLHDLGAHCFKIERPHYFNGTDRETEWSGKNAEWNETIRNIDIGFACETILRAVSGEKLSPLEPIVTKSRVPVIESVESPDVLVPRLRSSQADAYD